MQHAANELDITIQAVYQWPDPLTANIEARVMLAVKQRIKREQAVKTRKEKRDAKPRAS